MTRFALFYQSVISDWNHGNAHFLRGLVRALQTRGHTAVCYEERDNWSLQNLLTDQPDAIAQFEARFPDLRYVRYERGRHLEGTLRGALAEADVAIVHEWNEPEVIDLLGRLASEMGVRTVFHDTHYRVVQDDAHRARLGLPRFELILAYSPSLADRFRALGFSNVHVVHEAADTTLFQPLPLPKRQDVVFVGNYGDGDRDEELERFVFEPRREVPHLRYAVYGVRYPETVLARLRNGLDVEYRGAARNWDVPRIYSESRIALHVPRRQYVELLPGTPTIRVFEALSIATCLVSLPWPDTDGLFHAGRDYVVVETPRQMHQAIEWLARDDAAREAIGCHGRQTVLARHTCDHRAQQILGILGIAA